MRKLVAAVLGAAAAALVALVPTRPAFAYIEAPHTLGTVITLSTNIVVMRVEKVDKERNLIVYRKVRDLKGKHPTEIIKHNIGRGGFHPREWQWTMQWAEPGKIAVFFHNGSAGEICITNYWYQMYAGGDWWNLSHAEPYLLRTFCGRPEKLVPLIEAVLAGKEAIVPCMTDGNKEDLQLRRARMWRMRASLKRLDYNAKRDFVGWGGEDLRRLAGMPGFTHFASLGSVGPEAQAVSVADFDGDGKPDFCLVGASKTALMQNGGDAFSETNLPGLKGARAAVWADYNGDGKPDLLLATPTGPKLYTNLGGGHFRDDSSLLPVEPFYNLTAAAWIDYDGDGKPDILLGNGFHGLRLYRNRFNEDVAKQLAPPQFSDWHYIGPFREEFDTAFPPEQEIDFKKAYSIRSRQKAVWKKGNFHDGQINNLALFLPPYNQHASCYVYREIHCAGRCELPVSLGSDDTLTVWVNGEKVHAENVQRACAPDQVKLNLHLKPGKNTLLLKICQGGGEWAFYFAAGPAVPGISGGFEDVSAKVGFGPDGIGGSVVGDSLAVVDVNGDGRPDFLYGAGRGMLVLNTPNGFVLQPDSGLDYQPGGVAPTFGDFDNDGFPDLFVPQPGGCKLYRNDGTGHFLDVTAKAGDLGLPVGQAVCGAWGDFENSGRLDLVIGCLRGPNRYLRNNGNGTFTDATEEIGLHQRVFNTRGIALADVNNDGALDLILCNEGQESALLLGNPARSKGRIPVTVLPPVKSALGSRVRVLAANGQVVGTQEIQGGDGRGGQPLLAARFALPAGKYRVELRDSRGQVRTKDVTVGTAPQRVVVE